MGESLQSKGTISFYGRVSRQTNTREMGAGKAGNNKDYSISEHMGFRNFTTLNHITALFPFVLCLCYVIANKHHEKNTRADSTIIILRD